MKPSKYREQGIDELQNEEAKLQDQVFKLRFQNAIGQLDNPLKLRTVRRDLARVKTILHEKRIAKTASEGAGG